MPSIKFQMFIQPRNQNSVTSRLGSAELNGISQNVEMG